MFYVLKIVKISKICVVLPPVIYIYCVTSHTPYYGHVIINSKVFFLFKYTLVISQNFNLNTMQFAFVSHQRVAQTRNVQLGKISRNKNVRNSFKHNNMKTVQPLPAPTVVRVQPIFTVIQFITYT